MSDSESSLKEWLLTAAAGVAGPAAAVLHEAGVLSLGPAATLWPIGFIVVAAVVGAGTGVRLTKRVSRPLGVLAIIPNVLVLALYAFLLLFFGLGGSR